MEINNKNKKKKKAPCKNIDELIATRDGGRNALSGYSYQFLYSCYLILLSSDESVVFNLEGVEDIDKIKVTNNEKEITHIQLKYSTQRQNASFLKSVLKNFLETYLISKDRVFKLVYDFPVANGNLSKLFAKNLDSTSIKYWKNQVEEIKEENSNWSWDNFNFDDFFSCLIFKKIEKSSLENEIENLLISRFQINVNNISLYANAIKLLCLDNMTVGGIVTYQDLIKCIEKVKFEISKGEKNPAHSWIQKINFIKNENHISSYYEGKKATATDIANNLPIERKEIEKEIIDSINNNTITIIKTSSGQGKTTLALRTIFALKDEYTPYQITYCNNVSELNHIVEYFYMRTRIGEKPILLFDNLNSNLSQWNMLAQLMQNGVSYHYKIIVTTRESDWYNFSGDVSDLHSIKIIKPELLESEAKLIFENLKKVGKIHSEVKDWKNAWNKISDKKLLIEYVYLLTHGEMIADRIANQMKNIAMENCGHIKCEILRKVCFADMCDIKIKMVNLINEIQGIVSYDVSEIMKSLSNEFFINIISNGNYIEGLHPIRSQHIVNYLHENISLDDTAVSVTKIVEKSDIAVLMSNYPQYVSNKIETYTKIIDSWWGTLDLSNYVEAIRGIFSGSVLVYYRDNKEIFDDAFKRGGLPLLITDICPFAKFKEYNEELNTLDRMLEMFPDNENVKALVETKKTMPSFAVEQTDIYFLCLAIYKRLKNVVFTNITDINSYAKIVDWLYNINSTMNLAANINLEYLWSVSEQVSIETMSSLMYLSFCGNKDTYISYVNKNISNILTFLKQKTNSHILFIDNSSKEIIVKYILEASKINNANKESVTRLTFICKTLPIFDYYCADAIKPKIDLLNIYKIPSDDHKRMPKRNIIISFHQEFNGLWLKTLQSNYEFETVKEWCEHWLQVREYACEMLNLSCLCMYKLLGKINLGNGGKLFDDICAKYNNIMVAHLSYPRENRPFETTPEIVEKFAKAKRGYFMDLQNYSQQFVKFIQKQERAEKLVMHDLNRALAGIHNVQKFFDELLLEGDLLVKHNELKQIEERVLLDTHMCCKYYSLNQPNSYFNKYQIKKWYLDFQTNNIQKLNNNIMGIKEEYDVIFPKEAYRDDIFMSYPIILKKFDITNENMLNDFLIKTLEFANSPYDYLILLLSTEDGKVMNEAMKFPKGCYKYLHDSLIEGVEKEMNDWYMPYPINVNAEILECFEESLVLQPPKSTKPYLGVIADIAEKLWMYSKNREILTKKLDELYLYKNLEKIKSEISKMVEENKDKFNYENYSYLDSLCQEVFNGKYFGDEELNKIYEIIQSKSTS